MEGNLDSRSFTEELHWCIGQLELGLQRQSPNSRQAVEAIKVLKILKSQKAPMVKKRQVMRNFFGDYRKKMKDAEKKSLSGLRHSRFQPLGAVKASTASRFFKMSCHKQHSLDHFGGDLDRNLSNLNLQTSMPVTSASQNAANLYSDLANDKLAHQTGQDSSDSMTANLPNRSTFESARDGGRMETLSPNKIFKVPEVPQNTDGALKSSSAGAQFRSCSSHAVQTSSGSGSSSTAQSAPHGSSAVRDYESSFKYAPTDNSFAFNFEVSENAGCCQNVVGDNEAETPVLGQHSSLKCVSEKSAESGFKYEKSENEFCFNFMEAGDEL